MERNVDRLLPKWTATTTGDVSGTPAVVWQTADPQLETVPGFTNVGDWDLAPLIVANGVVYGQAAK